MLSAEGCGVVWGVGGDLPSVPLRDLLKTAVNELSTNVAVGVGDGYITRGDTCTIRVLAVRGCTAQTYSSLTTSLTQLV